MGRPAPARTRRPRRSQDEVRRRLLDAARERFATHGYAGVSTRTIAADAEAAESQIFTYFGTKAGLFEAAVLEPFDEFHREFNEHWQAGTEVSDVLAETRLYVRGMFTLLKKYRTLVLALIAADTFEHDGLQRRPWTAFSRLLPPTGPSRPDGDGQSWLGYTAAGQANLSAEYDVPTTVRITFGAILATSVLDHLFYDENSPPPDDEHLIEHITQLMVNGFRGPR